MLHLMSVTKMSQPPKSPKKCERTQNVMLKGVSSFLKQLTIASVAALLYAMTFVTFVALCVPLALCCDQSSRVVNLTYSLSESVVMTFGSAVITFGSVTTLLYLLTWLFRYFTK